MKRLLDWFSAERRDMPWRRVVSPWRTLVSEIMLQQTRVAVVAPRFEEFLARFPDPRAMARATEDDVLALWSGLGYYRRARSLHAAARAIVLYHDGEVPADRKALRALPGIGEYTAGAILSIAFGLPEPVVDGNVERVFARLHRLKGNVKRGETRKRVRELAVEAVRTGPPSDVNQALMELGALVCLPRGPRCDQCPLVADCAAAKSGDPESFPTLPTPKETVAVALAVAVVVKDGQILLVRHPEGGFLSGTFGPPFARMTSGENPADAIARAGGMDLEAGELLGTIRHQITHHRIVGHVLAARLTGPLPSADARFVTLGELPSIGLSSFARKSLQWSPGEGDFRC
jgi:A/G-specific adenine glycosylase